VNMSLFYREKLVYFIFSGYTICIANKLYYIDAGEAHLSNYVRQYNEINVVVLLCD